MARSSTNDNFGVHPYLVATKYKKLALDRLNDMTNFYSEGYRNYLRKQIADCNYEIWKKNKPDSIIPKTAFFDLTDDESFQK